MNILNKKRRISTKTFDFVFYQVPTIVVLEILNRQTSPKIGNLKFDINQSCNSFSIHSTQDSHLWVNAFNDNFNQRRIWVPLLGNIISKYDLKVSCPYCLLHLKYLSTGNELFLKNLKKLLKVNYPNLRYQGTNLRNADFSRVINCPHCNQYF